MREIIIGDGKPLRLTPEDETRAAGWLMERHQRAFDSRRGIEGIWDTALRQYYGMPLIETRNRPFENAPNTEITIGALATDSVYAQAMDLIFSTRPAVTIRSRMGKDEVADAVQDYVNWGCGRRWKFRNAVKQAILDCVQLGTLVFYIPHTQSVRRTSVRTVLEASAEMHSLAPEDFIVPVNAGQDLEALEFCTMRLWLSDSEMVQRGKRQGWNSNAASPSGERVSPLRRSRLAMSGIKGDVPNEDIYQVMDTFCTYDIFDDGEPRELEIIWDFTSGRILKALYNQWDCRPFVAASYQDRAHVFYGLGVPEMVAPFQIEITEIHNQRTANMILANNRMWKGPPDLEDEFEVIYVGKYFSLLNPDELQPMVMADIYPSSPQAEAMTLAFIERRVGINELAAPARLGGRTPGITAMSALQQANRRFFPAFDNIRNAVSEAVFQCLYRTQEQIKDGNEKFIEGVRKVLGERAQVFLDLMQTTDTVSLHDNIDVELTSSSVSTNKESDRQNMVMLSQMVEKYVSGMNQLRQLMQQDPSAKPFVEAGMGVINKAWKKIIRTFDQVSDPNDFIIEVDEAVGGVQQGMGGLSAMFGGMPAPGATNGGPPAMPGAQAA